jgi:hypothetical protein
MSCGRGYSFQAFSGVTALPHLVMSGEGAGFQSAAKTAVETADKTSAISERKSMKGTPTGCKTIAPLGQTALAATGFVILLRNMHSSIVLFLGGRVKQTRSIKPKQIGGIVSCEPVVPTKSRMVYWQGRRLYP